MRFYVKRGAAEQWIEEGKQAAHWTRLSCHRSQGKGGPVAAERAHVQPLESLAAAGAATRTPTMTILQQRNVKTGGRRVKYARCYWPLLAESHLTRRLFWGDAQRIRRCRLADVTVAAGGRSGEKRAQHGRVSKQPWAGAGSASGISGRHGGRHGVLPRATRISDPERTSGCRLGPIFGSKIGSVCAAHMSVKNVLAFERGSHFLGLMKTSDTLGVH